MNKLHEKIEKNVGLMAVLIAVAVSFGGLAEIVPLMYQAEAIKPLPGVEPPPALQLAGRDIYIREGCYNCHSQMIRPFRAETERYGPYSVAGEFVYDHPFQWGSKRTGPDLARVGARYSDDWHRVHLNNPRDVVPESNMPGYPWLAGALLVAEDIQPKMRALRRVDQHLHAIAFGEARRAGLAALVDERLELVVDVVLTGERRVAGRREPPGGHAVHGTGPVEVDDGLEALAQGAGRLEDRHEAHGRLVGDAVHERAEHHADLGGRRLAPLAQTH